MTDRWRGKVRRQDKRVTFAVRVQEFLASVSRCSEIVIRVTAPLRFCKLQRLLLAGMSANLCTQAHMHELLEQGFEVAVIKDATAAAQIPEGDGYLAALINFRFMANAVWTTEEAVKRLSR